MSCHDNRRFDVPGDLYSLERQRSMAAAEAESCCQCINEVESLIKDNRLHSIQVRSSYCRRNTFSGYLVFELHHPWPKQTKTSIVPCILYMFLRIY